MSRSDLLLRIKRDTNSPPIPITFEGLDLTGSVVEMVLHPQSGTPLILSSADGGLVLDLPGRVLWPYTEDQAAALPLGQRTKVDIYRLIADAREALASGALYVAGAGEGVSDLGAAIVVPGAQGPSGTVEIADTVTLPAGEPAYVENTGTPEKAVLTLYVPQGASGDVTPEAVAAKNAAEGAAGEAIDAAAIAVTQAGVATTQRVQAEVARTGAEAAQATAQTAASAAATGAKYFGTIALGRAAVANGETFGVFAGGSDNLPRPTLFRRDSSSTQTSIVEQVSGAEIDRPVWTGKASLWPDPIWRDVELGEDFTGRSRWFEAGGLVKDKYTLVSSVVFGGRALRFDGLHPGVNIGPRLWLDEAGVVAGDTITLRTVLTGADATGIVAMGFVNAAGVGISGGGNLTSLSGSASNAATATPLLLTWSGTVPSGAVSIRVYMVRSSGSGHMALEALWGGKGGAADVPRWPVMDGDPSAAAIARFLPSQVEAQGERVTAMEGGQSYMLQSAGSVTPPVSPGDVVLAVTGVTPNATYGATFRGWAERYTPAGVSFNAVRVRSLGRKPDVAPDNYWRSVEVVVRAAASGNAHIGASSTLVAVGSAIVPPGQPVLDDLVIILRDPVTGAVKTLDDNDLGVEYLIGTYFRNASGGAAYGSPHAATQPNALSSPQSYWVTVQDPRTGDWQAFAGNWRVGVDHILLAAPQDVVVYSPTDDFLADIMGGAAGAVPEDANTAALHQYRARKAKGAEAVIALLGDSWTNGGYRMHTPLHDRFAAREGISAPGWVSANLFCTLPPGATRSRPGTWVERRANTAAIGPDNCDATATSNGAYLAVAGNDRVEKYHLHYLQQPGGGEISYAVGGGAATAVDTDGSLSYEVIEIDGPGQLVVTVTDAGSAGVTIAGVDLRASTAGEIVLHKCGASGGRASHFAEMPAGTLEAAYAALAPDVVQICLGTNDHAGSVGLSAFRWHVETIMWRIRSVLPLVDFVLIGPGPNGNSGAYQIGDYGRVLYEIAAEQGCAFVSLLAPLGDYSGADARGLYEDASHPNADGGRVIGWTIWHALYAAD